MADEYENITRPIEQVLDEAGKKLREEREADPRAVFLESVLARLERGDAEYGDTLDTIAAIWSALFSCPMDRVSVALGLAAVKMARHVHRRKDDNLLDLVGWIAQAKRAPE